MMRLLLAAFLLAAPLAGMTRMAAAQTATTQAATGNAASQAAHMVSPPACAAAGCQRVQPTRKVIHPNIGSFHKPQPGR